MKCKECGHESRYTDLAPQEIDINNDTVVSITKIVCGQCGKLNVIMKRLGRP